MDPALFRTRSGVPAMARTATVPYSTTDYDRAVAGFAPLDDDAIAAQTDAGSFSRGRAYFRGKRIFEAFRRENTLRARCHGSSGGPYRVEATLATSDLPKARNPVSCFCTCPRGGFCKHIVALLLTWVDDPVSFEVRPPIADILAGKSREELIALIEQMVRDHPNLEKLIDRPVLIANPLSDAPVNETAIREQIAAAIEEESGDDYDEYDRYDHYDAYGEYDGFDEYENEQGHRIATKLEPLVKLLEAYADAGHWRNSLLVAATFVEEVAPHLTEIEDEAGELDALVSRADAKLAACLDIQNQLPAEQRLAPEERKRLIEAIFTVWQADVDYGGIGLSVAGAEAIARRASPEEQQHVAERVRKTMNAVYVRSDRLWHKRAAIGFLSLLQGEAGLSDEQLLAEYRDAELWDDAAAMLLRLGRFDEAFTVAIRRLTAPALLLPFADQVIATDNTQAIDRAMTIVDDRLWEHEGQNLRDDELLRAWLERRYAERGQPEKSLQMARERFDAAPTKATYDAVKAAALLPGHAGDPWPELRPKLVASLRKRGDWHALIDVNLDEGDVAEAVKALERCEKSQGTSQLAWGYSWSGWPEQYATRVAKAAEADLPDESIRIYRTLAERRIAARDRVNYQEAARHLVRVKQVLETNDRAAEWPPLIGELRQQNKNLRALREELDALGLQ
jgi:uncharacterized Zn finger protein